MSDSLARAIGQRLGEAWGQQVIVENRGGANHQIGAASVAKAPPDGHMLMLAAETIFVINPTLYGSKLRLRRQRLRADHRAGPHQPGAAGASVASRPRASAS